MKNSKLFEPELELNSHEIILYRMGVIVNEDSTVINAASKNLKFIPPIFLKFENCKYLNFRNNKITKIENIPNSVQTLKVSINQIKKIENIPESVIELDLWANHITKIENIPEGLKELYLMDNPLKYITKQALEIIKKNNIKVGGGVDINNLEIVD